MPGRLFLTHSKSELAEHIGVAVPQSLVAGRNLAPGQNLTVWTGEDWRDMRWGIIPNGRVNARGRPVMETIVNARSETVFDKSAFEGTSRAVVLASGWYEWTGEKRKKTVWEFSLKSGKPLIIAAITDTWSAPGGQAIHQVATLTCEPNADVSPIHHRMGLFIEPSKVSKWLDGNTDVLPPLPDGLLRIRKLDAKEGREITEGRG